MNLFARGLYTKNPSQTTLRGIFVEHNKVLTNYSNQAMNRDVKELCRLVDINEEIRITTYKGNVRTDEIHPKWVL